MPVVDKYRPVKAHTKTATAPGAVLAGGLILAILLALFSPKTLRNTAIYDSSLPPVVRTTLRTMADLGSASPLGSLRVGLERLTKPLADTTEIFKQAAPFHELPAAAQDPIRKPVNTPQAPQWPATKPVLKKRVLIIGASSIQYALGTELERAMRERLAVTTFRKGKVSTGLTRPDVFDWPAEIENLLSSFHPDLVIAQFGGNDGQNILDGNGKPHEVYTQGWEDEYAKRVSHVTDMVEKSGADMLMLGMPNMRSTSFTKKMHWVNEITARATTTHHGDYIDVEKLAAGPDGAYLAAVEVDGISGRARLNDGIHFTRLGGQYVVRKLLPTILAQWPMQGAVTDQDLHLATMMPFAIPASPHHPASQALAWVPQGEPAARYPCIVILHGAGSSPLDLATHLGPTLAQIAGTRKVVLIAPDGMAHGWWMDGAADPAHRLGTWLRDIALPTALTSLPVQEDAPRGIVGISMGGHGALLAALDAPKRWKAVGSLSGVMVLSHAADKASITRWLGPSTPDDAAWRARSTLARLQAEPMALQDSALWIGVGVDDRHAADNEAVHNLLLKHQIPHAWRTYEGGHSWNVWQKGLPAMLRWTADVLSPTKPTPEIPTKAPQAPPPQ